MCRSEVNVLQPPATRFTEPIIDAHCHASEIPPTALMTEAGRLFNVELWIAICRFERIESLRRAFGEAIIFNVWLDYTHAAEPRRFAADNIAMLKKAARQGAHVGVEPGRPLRQVLVQARVQPQDGLLL